jgi:tRNA(fMet)-specific endonuclease VapC
MVLLDTDLLTLLERGQSPEADRLTARLSELSNSDAATTIINFEEQTRGWLAYMA